MGTTGERQDGGIEEVASRHYSETLSTRVRLSAMGFPIPAREGGGWGWDWAGFVFSCGDLETGLEKKFFYVSKGKGGSLLRTEVKEAAGEVREFMGSFDMLRGCLPGGMDEYLLFTRSCRKLPHVSKVAHLGLY
jgi:hypothetical protein